MSKILEDIEYVDPNPASIIESLRSIGYTLETAIVFGLIANQSGTEYCS